MTGHAVDFAQLALDRFSTHSAIQPYARSIGDSGDHIASNPKIEVACCVLLTCDWFPDSNVLGVSHFRRTWSNNIVLDYLTRRRLRQPCLSGPTLIVPIRTAGDVFVDSRAYGLE
jgi:hypothetical protein